MHNKLLKKRKHAPVAKMTSHFHYKPEGNSMK